MADLQASRLGLHGVPESRALARANVGSRFLTGSSRQRLPGQALTGQRQERRPSGSDGRRPQRSKAPGAESRSGSFSSLGQARHPYPRAFRSPNPPAALESHRLATSHPSCSGSVLGNHPSNSRPRPTNAQLSRPKASPAVARGPRRPGPWPRRPSRRRRGP